MAEELSIFSMGVWTVKEDREKEFIESWKAFAKWTADSQAGTMGAYLTRDRSNPQVFVSFGPWMSDDAMLRWRGTREFKEFFARAKELCAEVRPMTLDTVTTTGPALVLVDQEL